jgi:hypothetical protein
MGGSLSKAMDRLFGWREMRVLMLGLDAAGKTTILYKLKLDKGEVITTIPTVGFNVESVMYKRVKFNVWDVGGQDKIRPLWRHYYSGKLRPQFCWFPDRMLGRSSRAWRLRGLHCTTWEGGNSQQRVKEEHRTDG